MFLAQQRCLQDLNPCDKNISHMCEQIAYTHVRVVEPGRMESLASYTTCESRYMPRIAITSGASKVRRASGRSGRGKPVLIRTLQLILLF